MSIEAMKLALDCLEDIFGKDKIDVGAINALRQAIADAEKQEPDDLTIAYMSGFHDGKNTPHPKPEQKPVACPFPCGWKRLFEIIVADGAFLARSLEEGEAITEHQREVVMHVIGYAKDMALHGMETTPPQRKWVGLTDAEITELHHEIKVRLMGTYKTEDIYRAIEAKLREKSGG